ncbi:winged helix-turn-helix domain-containing protein [Parvularcula marina]|nr:transcriptional regulator [Parvularcula marina]
MADSSIEKIDDIIHGRLRMGIMAYLINADAASFSELKEALSASQGNLSVQIRKLEDAGYISVDKRIADRKPLTTVRLTDEGEKAFKEYIKALTDVLGLPPKT